MSKEAVHAYWQEASCGEVYATGPDLEEQLAAQARRRYELEPYIRAFARFEEGRDRSVLEIGVGMGADHLEWARYGPRRLTGIDFTRRALEHTSMRLRLAGYRPHLLEGDAERLPFPSNTFDLVYSWGVLHHTPDTAGAIREVHRVLRPGGVARMMIYHRRSVVGALLWMRYALVRGRLRTPLDQLYAEHLESPGTKAYGVDDCRELFQSFTRHAARPMLSFADLLEGEAGSRHGGSTMALARRFWPRWLIRRAFRGCGLYLLIDASK
jgi:ubiquinone/menaquinone biosynthesis C-methylase UbiE